MRYRKFGNTDLLVSEIGFGAWAIGGPAKVGNVEIGWGNTDDRESKRAIAAALDHGINFFDTADFYGLGHSEELLGKTLAGKDALIATKMGQRVGQNGNIIVDYSYDYVLEACEKSLKRLKRECIDFYQLHVARIQQLKDGECIEAMEKLQQEGKIRYYGISLNTFEPQPEAGWFFNNRKGNGFQLVLNFINRQSLTVVEQAAQMGYGVIARMALQFGLLSGKVSPRQKFESNDHRSYRTNPEYIEQINSLLETFKELADKYQTTLAGIALSFVLGYPGISTVIAGMRTVKQVEMNSNEPIKLSANDHAALANLKKEEWDKIWQTARSLG